MDSTTPNTSHFAEVNFAESRSGTRNRIGDTSSTESVGSRRDSGSPPARSRQHSETGQVNQHEEPVLSNIPTQAGNAMDIPHAISDSTILSANLERSSFFPPCAFNELNTYWVSWFNMLLLLAPAVAAWVGHHAYNRGRVGHPVGDALSQLLFRSYVTIRILSK